MRDLSLLYILILETHSKFARKKIPSARHLLSRHHKARSAYEQPQLKLGEEIESFEISRRLIAQNSKIPNPTLRWSWVFLELTRILSGIQFTTQFIDFFVVETKVFVGSFVNVILTRQTCCPLSSRATEGNAER